MSTMERLFVEIFDRKTGIERQLHQQFESYGESLSLNVIADGGRPPPWLWEMSRGTACCPDPGGRCRYLVDGYQSFLTASFPVQERGLQEVQPETFSTEAVTRCVNVSAMTPDPIHTNDVPIPDEHSVRTDDDKMLLKDDMVIIGPDIATKSVIEKALTSGDGENYSLPSISRHCLKTSTGHNKNLISYPSVGDFCVNDSREPIEVIDSECEKSWPNIKKMKHKSRNIMATSPRSRARSFLDIIQQNECKYKAVAVSEAAVLQSSPKFSKFQVSTITPSVVVQNNDLHDLESDSDCNSNIHDLPIAQNGRIQIKALEVFEESLSARSRDKEVKSTNLMPPEAEIHLTSWGAESLYSDADTFDNNSSESLGLLDNFKELNDAQRCLYKCGITSISDTAGVKSNYDETMPVFEGFNIDLPYRLEDAIVSKDVDIPRIAKERAYVIEQLRMSSIFPSPMSKPSIMNKIDTVTDGFHSSPLGILENMELRFSLEHNNPDIKHFTTSSSMDISCNIGPQFDGFTLESSHSLSSSSAWFGSETKNPPLTPVRKFSHGRLSGKSSSSMTVNSIPELTCFRIDENSTTEGNTDFVQLGYSSHQTFSKNIEVSSNSKPLLDVTALYQNNTGFLSNLKEFVVRDSLKSINSGAASSLGFEFLGRESKIDNKENPSHTDGIQQLQKAAKTTRKISERSRISCKSSEIIGNYQNIGKGCKPSNILSSMSSFVPQIQQKKMGAQPFQGMKDIKVKALEAAEAAKRLEDQKKMEREKKKTEAKLMREKIKQENAKQQLKLKQKQKEEERKKKEEDVAARKRQREEEDRKVRERKKQCIEETRALQREREDKLHCEKYQKDPRQKDENLKKGKQRACKGQNKIEKDGVNGSLMDAEGQCPTVQAVEVSYDHNSKKGVGCSNNLREENEVTVSAAHASIDLLSYDMSPYLNSDDEDIEDSWRKKKYIPLWARRESLGEIILSNQQLDPKEIFSRKRSFNISQVLSTEAPPRRPVR